MRQLITIGMIAIVGSALFMPGLIFADALETRASDSAVKMIHFPQSLTVIWNRPASGSGKFDQIFNDTAILKRTLRKIDPARIAPATLGDKLIGQVTREVLDNLGKKYKVDLLLVFRRELLEERSDFLKLRYQALVYLVHQKKLLVVPASETETNFNESNWEEQITRLNYRGLKQLADNARKVIHSHKFEKRRSNY